MISPSTHPSAQTTQLLATLWERNRPLLLERLAQLDHTADSAALDSLTPADRHSAISTAHKLAGTLGMFGYPQGTELARSLELVLDAPGPLNPIALRELTVALRETLSL